jgi:glycine/D-amino acid oxidase-like deaminating enzyme
MTVTTDVMVIGAGIVGAACAFELAKEGLRVSIVDGGFIGGGATGAGMGHIVVMDDSEAQFALTRYSQMLWDDLEPEAPPNVEFDRCGTIWVAADDEEMTEVRRKFSYYGERGVQTEILDAQALREAEPNLRRPLAGGLLVRGDSVLYPPCAAAFLLEKARGFGARLHLEHRVARIGKGRAEADARNQHQAPQGSSCDHRSLSRPDQTSTGGARLSEERPLSNVRFRSLQRPAAQNGANPDWLFATI